MKLAARTKSGDPLTVAVTAKTKRLRLYKERELAEIDLAGIEAASMRPAILLMTLMGGFGCRASDTPDRRKDAATATAAATAAAAVDVDIAYGVDAARPRTSFDLHVPPTGDAELYLGAPVGAEEADTLGYFGAPVPTETRATLAQLVASGSLLSRSGGPSATAEGSGFLRLTSGSAKSELSLVAPDEGTNALRTKLDQLLVEVAHHPLRALRMTLAVTREGETLRPGDHPHRGRNRATLRPLLQSREPDVLPARLGERRRPHVGALAR